MTLPRRHHLRALPLLVAAAVAVLAAARTAGAYEVQCGTEGGDAFGWAVVTGGDFNGDGTPDIAISAPCAAVGKSLRVGRVKVLSGATGGLLLSRTGSAAEEEFGSALAWLPDLDGDGRSELVIGATGYIAPKPGGGMFVAAGKVDVRSSKGGIVWTLTGATANAGLGESIGVVPDLDGDGVNELVVGASGAQDTGVATGIAYLLSGKTGSLLVKASGDGDGDLWGSLVGEAGDVNGDGTPDWLAGSKVGVPSDAMPAADLVATTTTTVTTTTLVPRAGRVTVYSGKAPYEALVTYAGETFHDRLGRAAASTDDSDNDGLRDLWIGSPGATPNLLENAGSMSLYSAKGPLIHEITEPIPQKFASFGTAIVVPGSLDGGTVSDVVASAPDGKVSGKTSAGRVYAFAGENFAPLWMRSGALQLERFGESLATGFDYNHDGVPDILAGAPGDAPNGKRGAGSVYILSGKDGSDLASFGGRRGRETRIFVAGPGLDREAVVRSFDPFGRRREANFVPFPGQAASALSMDVLNPGRREETINGTKTLLAIGSGRGGDSPTVTVYRANRRGLRLSRFTAGPATYTGGLNVAAGDFTTFDDQELAVAPADSTGDVYSVEIWRPEFVDPVSGRITWSNVRTFPVFSPTDKIDNKLVSADGVHLAAGDLTPVDLEEIVAAPAAGLPAVRVFGRAGVMLSEWQAYPSPGDGAKPNSGTSIAVGDLDGEGGPEIVTAPASGQPWIRVWRGNGTQWLDQHGQPVSFFVTQYGLQFADGLVVTTADVDFDGQAEIIVAPGNGNPPQILAFEIDGSLVKGWVPYQPFGPLAKFGLGLCGLDQFWKP